MGGKEGGRMCTTRAKIEKTLGVKTLGVKTLGGKTLGRKTLSGKLWAGNFEQENFGRENFWREDFEWEDFGREKGQERFGKYVVFRRICAEMVTRLECLTKWGAFLHNLSI